jgi:diguanylate cyclase (GGDEF)-like protein
MAVFGSVEKSIAGGFCLSLFGLIAMALVAYSVSKEEIESADWVEHTQEVIGTLQEIQRYALDAESTGRGFIVSGAAGMVDEYKKLIPRISEKIAAFRELTRDNLKQQQNADDLLALVRLRFASLTNLMELRNSRSLDSIAAEAALGKGRGQMKAIKVEIGEMIDEENRLLKERKMSRDKSVHIVWATIVVMVMMGGAILAWVFNRTFVSVRLRRAAEDRANHLAHHDALTGLPNRRMLQDRLAQALSVANRYGHMLAIMFLDLDGFKKINDSFGHDAGDELLKEVAQRLTASLRNEDTAVRIGGDEFVIGLMRLNTRADAAAVAVKLVAELAKPYQIGGHALTVTTSVGISVFPGDAKTSDELLKHADDALYKAKQGGKNRYRFFADEAAAAMEVA